MAITKFKITRNPFRAKLKFGATEVLTLNQEYPIARQSELIANVSGVGVPYDSFLFKVGNANNVWSDDNSCTINVAVGTGTPAAQFPIITMEYRLFDIALITPLFVFDANTDRIRFTQKITPNYGFLKINGVDLIIGKTYFLYEFINVRFYSTYTGVLQNVVCDMKYQVGNVNEWSPENTWIFKSLANMQGEINGKTTTATV